MNKPVKLSDETLEAWNRLRRPSDFVHLSREMNCSKQLLYDAFYRRQTSERVYDALAKYYAKREKALEERLRKARLDIENYETQQQ